MTTETLEQFSERMSQVNKEWEHDVGRSCYGNKRAMFVFENQSIFNESRGFRVAPYKSRSNPLAKALWMLKEEPRDYWWTGYATFSRIKAKKIAKYYNAKIEENPYAEVANTWFHYTGMIWEDVMRFVYDRHTGKFVEMFGEEFSFSREAVNNPTY
jgi:hypothetical protein